MEENPYRPPTELDVAAAPERNDFAELGTRELKSLRNHSQTIRSLGVLAALAAAIAAYAGVVQSRGQGIGSEVAILFGLALLTGWTAYGAWARPVWGRVLGILFCLPLLLGFPLLTILGIFGLISYGAGGRLFGEGRFPHARLEREWRYRRKMRVP